MAQAHRSGIHPTAGDRPGSVHARRIEGERITMAVFELQPGAIVPEHEHPAEQVGLCIRGR